MSDRFVLSPQDRARPYALGAVLDLIGAALLVIGIDRSNTVLIVIAVVVFVLGLAISVGAVVLRQRLRTIVELDDHGLRISSGGRQAEAAWQDVSGMSADQRAIYLERDGDQAALKISSPRGGGDPRLGELSTELTRRLDENRGYRPLG